MKQLKFLMVAFTLLMGVSFTSLRVLMMMPAKACMME